MNYSQELLKYLKSISPDCLGEDGLINLKSFSEIYEDSIHKEKRDESRHRFIQHEIPNLGKVNIDLYGQAAELYNLLDKNGIINNLKKIENLGMITHSHPSNVHKRWDYVCLQLLLLQRLKYSSLKFLGLNSTIIKNSDETVSSEEYLQCQILFSSIGVIPGTVSSEKALLTFLINNSTEKEKLISPFKTEWNNLVIKIFNEYDYFKIKYLVALNFLYKQNINQNIKRTLLSFYNNDKKSDSSKIARAREIYYRIRRISFIYLDTLNSHFFSTLAVSKILFHISNYENLFNPNSHDWIPFFQTWEDTLTKMLYLSPHSIKQDIYNYNDVTQRLEKHKSAFNNCFLRAIIKSSNQIFPANSHKENPLIGQFYFTYKDVELYKDLFDLDLKKITKNILKIEVDFNNLLNEDIKDFKNQCYIVFDNSKQYLFINYLIDKSQISNAKILKFVLRNSTKVLIKFLDEINKEFVKEKFIYEQIKQVSFKSIIRKYLLFCIQLLTKYESKKLRYNAYIDYTDLNKIERPFYETNYFTKIESLNDYLTETTKSKSLKKYPDIINSINVLKEVIKKERINKKSKTLLCILPIKLDKVETDFKLMRNSDNPISSKPFTDIDIMLFVINKNNVDLIIVEGKSVRKGLESEINKSFNRLKETLVFKDFIGTPKILSNRKSKGGYIRMKLK